MNLYFHQAIYKKKIIRHRMTRRGRAAEKLDTMMAKVQRGLNLTPEKVRCQFVAKLFQTIAWSYG